MARTGDTRPGDDDGTGNVVLLRGRVTTGPATRELPSGACIVTLRISIPRTPSPMVAASRPSSDWVDLVVWGGRMRRVVERWRVDDRVEVEGALRRRFYRSGADTATRLEVEVLGGRVVGRSGRDASRRGAEGGAAIPAGPD